MGADVGVDLLGDVGARHFDPSWLAKEGGEFVGDTGWLGEATWLAVTRRRLLLCLVLAESLKLALVPFLEFAGVSKGCGYCRLD